MAARADATSPFWTPVVRRLMLLAALMLAAVLLVVLSARSRIAENERDARSAELLRLDATSSEASDMFANALELVRVEQAVALNARADDRLVEAMLRSLVATRRVHTIFGGGIFYAPRAFAADKTLYGPYVHQATRGVVLVRNTDSHTYDYPRLTWYHRAVRAAGQTIIIGPYREQGDSFISVLRAAYTGSRLRAVVSVDIRTRVFVSALQRFLRPDEIAYIASRSGTPFVSTRALPTSQEGWADISTPVRYTIVRMHLLDDLTPVDSLNRRVLAVAVALCGVILLIALLWAQLLFRSAAMREAARLSREREHALQEELDVRARVEERLRAAAFTDELTGLPNRAYLRELLTGAIENRDAVSLLLVDLDRFKLVNETFGRPAGDDVLRTAGARLSAAGVGTTLRLGADEFAVLVKADQPPETAARRVLSALDGPFAIQGVEVHLGASVGIVCDNGRYRDADGYLRDADIALNEAKSLGGHGVVAFQPAMGERVIQEHAMEVDFRRAIDSDELAAFYQPVVDTVTHEIVSFEALARWHHPEHGLVAASSFIQLAERGGWIGHVDRAMLRLVARDAATVFQAFPSASVAVNVSSAHLADERLIDAVREAMASGITASRLRVEITETAIMRDHDFSLEVLTRLQMLGIRIVVDDFGVGYSSLAYLQRLPIWGLKIDRSFVAPLCVDPHARAIVHAIVTLARALGLHVVAEGVEELEQAKVAEDLGVRFLQGFLFSEPLPVERIGIASVAVQNSIANEVQRPLFGRSEWSTQ
ncbi:MAG: EAL domain-containing protein [Candidatus Eremiobacteraeota bacterium]|nr:EAL domain-containing protein [Candidatus Eremiobacteraeota bacterium]